LLVDPMLKHWNGMIQRAGQEGLTAAQEIIVAVSKNTVPKMLTDPSFIRPIW
jgi:hypothetical protein